jgi:hypothetical protein
MKISEFAHTVSLTGMPAETGTLAATDCLLVEAFTASDKVSAPVEGWMIFSPLGTIR